MKKLKDIAAETNDANLVATVRESAHQIWLAGLGAFAKTQEEGVKVFDALVKEGEKLRKRGQLKVPDVAGMAGKVAADASSKAAQTWDKLDQVFEERVARALRSLGVPTHKELQALNARVQELTVALNAGGPKAKGPARRKVAKKAGR